MRKRTRWFLLVVMLLLTATAVGFAQDEPPVPPEPSALAEFITLLFSGGVVTALLQLFRRINLLTLIPGWLRPVLAGAIGIGAAAATTYLLENFGIGVDLSPIVAFFGAGGGATALFAIGKELGRLNHSG